MIYIHHNLVVFFCVVHSLSVGQSFLLVELYVVYLWELWGYL